MLAEKTNLENSSVTVNAHTDSQITATHTIIATSIHTSLSSDVEPYSIFTKSQKIIIVTIVSAAGVLSTLSTNIYLPAFKDIQKDLQVSAQLVSLTITMNLVFQGLSPTLWGTLADVYGLACTKNYPMLLALRMLQSVGSSAANAIGSGTISDIIPPLERGGYMGIFALCTTLGHSLGPFIGGAFIHSLGWRWIFWFLVIYAAPLLLCQIFLLPKTERILVGNGSINANPTPWQYYTKHCDEEKMTGMQKSDVPNAKTTNKPAGRSLFTGLFRLLAFGKEKDVICLFLYCSLQYGAYFAVLSSMTELFIDTYGVNEFQVGLCYLSNGFGSAFGSYLGGRMLNWRFKKIAIKLGLKEKEMKRGSLPPEFPIEKARMGSMWLWGLVFNLSLIAYGWCIHYKVHISVPIILNFVLSSTSLSTLSATNTLLVDLFPNHSAGITAAHNIPRCLFGAASVLLVFPGIQKLGIGWYFTTLSLVLFVTRITLVLELKFGPIWRAERKEKENSCILK